MPEWMNLIRIVTLVVIVIGSVAALLWLMRPSARRAYDDAAMIPLREDDESRKENRR